MRITSMVHPLLAFVFFIVSHGVSLANGDVLIVAPHPDDEVIGCAGVMMRAPGAGRHVTVVILSNGDDFADLAAASELVQNARLIKGRPARELRLQTSESCSPS